MKREKEVRKEEFDQVKTEELMRLMKARKKR